jgi:hypothetical protein
MNKYAVIFCVPGATMADWMQNTPEDEHKAQGEKMMQDWQAWLDKLGSAVVDKGVPLGKTKRVTEGGVADVKNELNFFMVIQAESHEAAAEMIKGNPHFMIPTSYVDVMEISQMGM